MLDTLNPVYERMAMKLACVEISGPGIEDNEAGDTFVCGLQIKP